MFRERIYLSPPRVVNDDAEALLEAMKSGWIAPAGPSLDQFEADLAATIGVSEAVALSSGTAAIHLALRYAGVSGGDVVVAPTLTFAATIFPICYLGANPTFVDVDESWNMDPSLLVECIESELKRGSQIAAIIPVDLYGTPANYTDLGAIAKEYGIPLVVDAAESLGASAENRMTGSFGMAGAVSFNGNKIITSGGGGALVTDDQVMAARVKFWATQARENAPWYEHRELGYNYRLSNVLSAIGRSQLKRLGGEVQKRRTIRSWFRDVLEELPGVSVQDDPEWGRSNAWLTVVTFSHEMYPDASRVVRTCLEEHNVESRPVWKPMHTQPLFNHYSSYLSGAAERIFREGLCLPSGTALTHSDVEMIGRIVRSGLEEVRR